MYRLAASLPNDIALNLIPEVCFDPDVTVFAVTHQQANEVVEYGARSRGVVRVFRNPDARLDNPHDVLLTDQYLIGSNAHGITRPSSFSVHRLDAATDQPASSFVTPCGRLREAHSLAPDGSMRVVNNNGLKVENENIHWMTSAQGYTNSVLVYDRCPAQSTAR